MCTEIPGEAGRGLQGTAITGDSHLHTVAQTATRVWAQRPTDQRMQPSQALWFRRADCPSISHFVAEGSMGSLHQWSASQAVGPELP